MSRASLRSLAVTVAIAVAVTITGVAAADEVQLVDHVAGGKCCAPSFL